MKCRLTVENPGVNPAYSLADHQRAKAAGKAYDVPKEITYPVGFEFEGDLAWTYCVPGYRNEAPKAEPIDDECRAAVRKHLEQHQPAAFRRLQALVRNPPKNPHEKAHVFKLAKAYGLLDGDGTPATAPSNPEKSKT